MRHDDTACRYCDEPTERVTCVRCGCARIRPPACGHHPWTDACATCLAIEIEDLQALVGSDDTRMPCDKLQRGWDDAIRDATNPPSLLDHDMTHGEYSRGRIPGVTC